ncbi:UNVERIFIED_CONTAM: hypothetical protein FKN15_075743 [Acipenser sinensis]
MATPGVCGIDVLVSSSCTEDLGSPCDDEAGSLLQHETDCCTKESRGETPGREDSRIDPPDGQQDPEADKSKEKKGLGKEVLLLMQALNTLASPEEKLAALCKKYADLKTVQDKDYKALQLKLERLEKLCRAMQRERNDLNKKMEVLQGQLSEGNRPTEPAMEAPSSTEQPGEEETVDSASEDMGTQPDTGVADQPGCIDAEGSATSVDVN